MSERIRNRHLRTNGPDGTYAYRGVFPHLGGRVARNVSERIVLFKFCCFSRKGCTERVGTYVYGGTFPYLNGRVARNVWERICRAGRFRDSTGGLHGTCRNVCL